MTIEGQAFMFTPGGPVPMAPDGTLLEVSGFSTTQEHGATVPRAAVVAIPTAARSGILPVVTTPTAAPLLRPRDVVKAARARATEIRTELRRMKHLEKELGELDRLIAAAKHKPVAIVRQIDHARQAR